VVQFFPGCKALPGQRQRNQGVSARNPQQVALAPLHQPAHGQRATEQQNAQRRNQYIEAIGIE